MKLVLTKLKEDVGDTLSLTHSSEVIELAIEITENYHDVYAYYVADFIEELKEEGMTVFDEKALKKRMILILSWAVEERIDLDDIKFNEADKQAKQYFGF